MYNNAVQIVRDFGKIGNSKIHGNGTSIDHEQQFIKF